MKNLRQFGYLQGSHQDARSIKLKKPYDVVWEHPPNFLQLVFYMLRSCWVDMKQLQEITRGVEASRKLIIDN
jgi:hypothetical protein